MPTERFRLQLCASGACPTRCVLRLPCAAAAPDVACRLAGECLLARQLRCGSTSPRAAPCTLVTPLNGVLRLRSPPAAGVSSLHPAVADRLPAVLLAAASALAAGGKRDQLQAVVAFASAVPNRISQAVYRQLNQLQASVA